MKILIEGVNTNNINNLDWCLGFAGLAQMSQVLSDTKRQINFNVNDILSEDLGDMALELYKYNFTFTITK